MKKLLFALILFPAMIALSHEVRAQSPEEAPEKRTVFDTRDAVNGLWQCSSGKTSITMLFRDNQDFLFIQSRKGKTMLKIKGTYEVTQEDGKTVVTCGATLPTMMSFVVENYYRDNIIADGNTFPGLQYVETTNWDVKWLLPQMPSGDLTFVVD